MIRESLGRIARTLSAAALFLAAPVWLAAQPASTPGAASSPAEATPTGSVDPPATAPAVATPSVAPAMPTLRVEESPLETFYLFDKEGNLVPVIKAYTIEELEDFLRQKLIAEGAEDAPRAYSLQELELQVLIDPDRVSATAKFKIKLHRAGWTRVPLRFDEMALEGEPQSPSSDRLELEYDRAEGWIAYFRGEADEVVELSLPLISLTTTAHEDQSWRATLPTATNSTARLSIAGGPWEIEEAPRAIVRETAFDGERTSISLRLVGEAAISWSKPTESEAEMASFEAIETSRISVDSQTEAACESSFLVQPLDGPVKTVYLVLSEGTRFLPASASSAPNSATVAVATPEERRRVLPGGGSGTLLRVDAPMPSMTSFRFSVAYRAATSKSERLVLERPWVVRAVRQSGTVEVSASDEWNLGWTLRGSLERIDRSADDEDQPGAAAMFAYSQAPAPLEISIEPRTSQLIVDPLVLFDVGRRETNLDLRLTCRFQGVGEFKVELPGWTVTEVGPSTLVDSERLNLAEVDPLSVPFVDGVKVDSGEAEVRIVATRRRPEGENRLELSIPRIEDAVVNPALIAVQSADEVQVLELPGETQGLTPDVWTADSPLEERQQAPLIFRNYGDVSDARIVLTAETKARQLAVDERAELILRADGLSLEQRFAVQASYGKLDRFDVWIPAERLLDDIPPVMTVNGVEATPLLVREVDLTSEAPLAAPEGMKRFRLDVVPPRSGLTVIALPWNQSLPPGESVSDERVRLAQPILPPDAQRTVQPAVVRSVAPVRLEMDLKRWQSTGDPEAPGEDSDRFIAADAANLRSIDFRRSLRQVATGVEPRAERMWLHTEATAAGLRHRFAVRIRNPGDMLRVRLPDSALAKSAVVAWNGVEQVQATDGILQVNLAPSDADPQSAESPIEAGRPAGTLEIWYVESRDSAWAGIEPHLPETGLDAEGTPFYWSMRLPPEETVLDAPRGMRSESNWRWTGWRFTREPALTVRDLEEWSGATRQPSAGSRSASTVYSALQPPATIRLASVPRTWAYLLYGLSAFMVASAWIYVPRLRRAWVAAGAAVGLATLALWAPELALPAAQVAAFGLAFAVIAAVIDWWLHGSSGAASVRSVSTVRRERSQSGTPIDEKPELSTQSLPTSRAEVTA